MIVRDARQQDNNGLLHLTSLLSMKGTISLRIDRDPDFFALLKERGFYHILVAENQGEIVGTIAVTSHEAFILGRLRRVFYISDFKVHPKHQNSRLAYNIVKALLNYLISVDADILLCTSILGNDKVEPFFGGHLGIPPFTEMATFNVFQILPNLFKKKCSPGIDLVDETGLDELSDFFNQMSQVYSMNPFTGPADLGNKINLTLRENGQITAAICLADYMHLKQNVVTEIPMMLRVISRTSNLLERYFPIIHLPKEGEAIRLLNVKRFASIPGRNSDLKQLINCARHYLFQGKYTFLTIALHPSDPHQELFRKLPKFTFFSKLWISSLKGDVKLLNTLKKGILAEDYSLV